MAIIDALKGVDRATAADVLAAAAISTGNDPGVGEHSRLLERHRDIASRVIEEARNSLKIDATDTSQKANRKLEAFLLQEIVDATNGGKDESVILAKAGARGALPPSSYHIQITSAFKQQFRPLGVVDNTVKRAISTPTDFQHLHTEVDVDHEGDVFSLFVLEMNSDRLGRHWLLVQTIRDGVFQIPKAAWWIHPSMVDLANVHNPYDLLMAFVAKFGGPLRIEETNTTIGPETRVSKGAGEEFTFNLKVPPDTFQTVSWITNKSWDFALVTLAYQIDLLRYQGALKRIGAI